MNVIDLITFSIWQPLKDRMKLYLLRERIKKAFPESYLVPDNVFPIEKVGSIGKETYGFFKLISFGERDMCRLRVGNYCSIGQEVTFISGGEHPVNRMSTFPFDKRILGETDSDRIQKGDIIIEDDVWIGYGATIMSGVKIGQGAVIGARSVVAKDIPPYAIYGGGKIIKYRFNEDICEKLKKVRFEKLSTKMVREYIDFLKQDASEEWFEGNTLYDELVQEWAYE